MTRSKPSIVCEKEIREILRDRRSLLQVFAFPILLGLVADRFFLLMRHQTFLDIWSYFCPTFALFAAYLNIPIGVSMTTGEKERNTAETDLTLCVSRKELILGKYLAIMLCNVISAAVMFLSIIVANSVSGFCSLSQVSFSSGQFYHKLIICYFVYSGQYIIWFSSMILLTGLFARNTKEATGLLNALFMATAFVPVAGMGFGMKLTFVTILVPIANCSVVCRQFMNSTVEWYWWLILLCTVIIYTWIPIQYAIRLIKSDAMLNPP